MKSSNRGTCALTTVTLTITIMGALGACASQPGAATDRATVVVPAQPPPPAATTPPTAPVSSAETPVASGPAFKCENGKRFEIGPRTYCAYTEPETWEASEHRCVDNGGHLMALDSLATSEAVHRALGSPLGAGRAAWIGLELKTKGKKDWKWATGEALTSATSSWKTNEPNNFDGNEQCGELLIASGQWNDTRCELKQPYLCQSKANAELACRRGRSFSANGTSYCLNNVDRSYPDAKKACAADGGAIATFKTLDEGKAVNEAIAARFAAPRMWIGLSNSEPDGWKWASGVPFEFQAWQSGEPNDFNGENCVELFLATWTWNDLDCGVKLPSVCESPAKRSGSASH